MFLIFNFIFPDRGVWGSFWVGKFRVEGAMFMFMLLSFLFTCFGIAHMVFFYFFYFFIGGGVGGWWWWGVTHHIVYPRVECVNTSIVNAALCAAQKSATPVVLTISKSTPKHYLLLPDSLVVISLLIIFW